MYAMCTTVHNSFNVGIFQAESRKNNAMHRKTKNFLKLRPGYNATKQNVISQIFDISIYNF